MTEEQTVLMGLLSEDLWVPNEMTASPLNRVGGQPSAQPSTSENRQAHSVAQRYDSLSLLKNVTQAKVLWILSEKKAFANMAEELKVILRGLIQSTRYSPRDIVPALVMNDNLELTDTQAEAELHEQCQSLGVKVIISHVPLALEEAICLPSASELKMSEAARQQANEQLKNAGLLLD